MVIAGLGTSVPVQRYYQKACWDVVQRTPQFQELTPRSRALLRGVLCGTNGIVSRHLALDHLEQAFDLTADTLQARFARHAPLLATEAAKRALSDARTEAEDIDALIISTCTGYLCPGLTSYVGQNLGLKPDILALDLVGQGCGAALPNLRTAEALLLSGRSRHVLSICVEVCSAAFFLDNDPGVLISACLFGDGAGAAVLSNESNASRRIEWKLSGSLVNPQHRDALRFQHQRGMLRNILSPEVPALAAAQASQVLSNVLQAASLERTHVKAWVLHPGGRDVLAALRKEMQLTERDVRWSASILSEYGNLSSPSVFFVLQAALKDSAPNGFWWMSSFGAGFSGHGALLEVEL